MIKLAVAALMLTSVSAQAQEVAEAPQQERTCEVVWDRICVGMTPREVWSLYGGRHRFQLDIEVREQITLRSRGDDAPITVVEKTFYRVTPDQLLASLRAKYGEPTRTTVVEQQLVGAAARQFSQGPTADLVEWVRGNIVISMLRDHDGDTSSQVTYTVAQPVEGLKL